MPAAVAVPLITGAITGATAIGAAKMQSGAARNAAAITAASTDKALAVQERDHAGAVQRYNDWSAGVAAHRPQTLGGLTGTPQMQMPAQSPAMITVVAPSGLRAMRPATERDHWISKGAQVLA